MKALYSRISFPRLALNRGSYRSLATTFKYDFEDLPNKNIFNVPPLPVPALEDTLRRYLVTVEPHLPPAELEKTKLAIEKFKVEQGPELHSEVLQLASDPLTYPHSYVEGFWTDMYLNGRWPLMIHTNPFYIMINEPVQIEMEQNRRAAKFISSSLRWWKKVLNGDLEPDMDKGIPMCMSQFAHHFGLARYPGLNADFVKPFPYSKHIVVICNNQHFKVDVFDENNIAISASALEEKLAGIQNLSRKSANKALRENDVGVLTSIGRTEYYKARKELEENSSRNKSAFESLDTCLFVLVLEEDSSVDIQQVSGLMLTGLDGTNRWFDKHQIIVNRSGILGVNFEHSSADGLTWNRWLHETWHDMHGTSSGFSDLPKEVDGADFGKVEPILWDLNESDHSNLSNARMKAQMEIDDLDLYFLDFNDYGRNLIKTWNVSPDAVVQMAMQLGYTRIHGKPAPTYEACAMKSYFHGRTETIRSCTNESVAMCRAFLSDASEEEKKAKFLSATSMHVNIAKGAKACIGEFQGVDRHLFAMKSIADNKEWKVPLFEDPAYSYTGTWVLSTSNVSMPIFNIFGFGAVCNNGYGFGYLTGADTLPMCITSFKSNQETGSKKIAESVSESLNDMKKLF